MSLYLRNCCSYDEIKLIFDPWGRKRVYVELWQMAKLVLKQSFKAHGPLVYEIFSFSLTWDPMGAKISKRCSYKSQPKAFKLFLNIIPSGPH